MANPHHRLKVVLKKSTTSIGTHKKIIAVYVLICLIIIAAALVYNKYEQTQKRQYELYRKGVEQFSAGNFDSAQQDLEEAARLNPRDDRPIRLLAKVYEVKGELDKAADSYLASLQVNPDQPETMYNLAIIYKSQGLTAEAIGKLEEAVARSKQFVAARLILGDLYAQTGEREKAREEYQAVIEMNPFGVDLESVKQKLEGLR